MGNTRVRIVVLTVVAVGVAAFAFVNNRPAPKRAVRRVVAPAPEQVKVVESPATEPAEPQGSRVVATAPVAEPLVVAPPAPELVPEPPKMKEAPRVNRPAPMEPLVPEPVARTALAFVGTDAEAEQVWVAAINDPMMPAKARQNLIEDLNEDGFPDHKNITADDIPLIVSRIQLIEELAPDAMDDVNAAAFAEAYKDLVNMFDKAMRR